MTSDPYTEDMPVRMAWGAPLTVADLADAPDDGHRYELIDGTLIVTPSPGSAHQTALGNLHLALRAAVPAELQVFLAPFDWVVSDNTVLQPDLMVCRRADVTPKNLAGPPLLAVEVLSPSTRAIDLGAKRLAMAAAGVDTYWVVDPLVPSLTVFNNDGSGAFDEVAAVTGDDAYETDRPYPVRVVPSDLLR